MTPDWVDGAQIPAPEPPAQGATLADGMVQLERSRKPTFATRPLGGYDRSEVDAFVAGLRGTIDVVRMGTDRLTSEAVALRAEIERLRVENARLQTASNPELEQEVTLGAVGLLSQAQMIADKAVADAEQYARDLVLTARNQYREVVERGAERAAEQSEADAATPAAAPMPPMPPMPEIEYVRTYAQVAQIQLRSVLDALTEQVDRLGTLPQADPAAAPSTAAGAATGGGASPHGHVAAEDEYPEEEPDWLPAVPPQPTVQRQTYISPTQ
ncbi:DivIVA domain-containing protein [Agromyces sp. LHK192]|uniref:DivIVA domain-containing protein n=1 Tax=Agromyces sp. LHK192 TaxID=2498704 RepID=UPI000FD6DFA5|nr:hypothetical protein [Agromyces sp. LHK192]